MVIFGDYLNNLKRISRMDGEYTAFVTCSSFASSFSFLIFGAVWRCKTYNKREESVKGIYECKWSYSRIRVTKVIGYFKIKQMGYVDALSWPSSFRIRIRPIMPSYTALCRVHTGHGRGRVLTFKIVDAESGRSCVRHGPFPYSQFVRKLNFIRRIDVGRAC